MADNWISKRVQGVVAGAGGYVGGAINGVGNSVNGVGKGIGDSIANTTRYWGQGVSGYGNDIKDSTGASGPRTSTAGNPLGLSGSGHSKAATGFLSSGASKGTSAIKAAPATAGSVAKKPASAASAVKKPASVAGTKSTPAAKKPVTNSGKKTPVAGAGAKKTAVKK